MGIGSFDLSGRGSAALRRSPEQPYIIKKTIRMRSPIIIVRDKIQYFASFQRQNLCVSLEAASPGEIKYGGAGWQIRFGFASTPFGEWLAAESPRGVCHVSFVEDGDSGTAEAILQEDWPAARLIHDDSAAAQLASLFFERSASRDSRPSLRAFVRGTAFQVRVWRALLQLPPGTLVSYGRLAAIVGRPAAARAVGTAVGRNPLACFIPCHRVIRGTGLVGNYRWGSTRKRAMVAWESLHSKFCEHSASQLFDPQDVPIIAY